MSQAQVEMVHGLCDQGKCGFKHLVADSAANNSDVSIIIWFFFKIVHICVAIYSSSEYEVAHFDWNQSVDYDDYKVEAPDLWITHFHRHDVYRNIEKSEQEEEDVPGEVEAE